MPVSMVRAVTPNPATASNAPASWYWSAGSNSTITWNSGCRAVERAGLTSSTTQSKGTSWFRYAASAVARVRPRTSVKLGSPVRSARNTTEFTKNPTRSSTAWSVLPATGAPNGMSVPAPSRDNSIATAAWASMCIVAPASRARAASRVLSSEGTSNSTRPPPLEGAAGRGRSAGRGISSGTPASASRQYASWSDAALPGDVPEPSTPRCQTVKSAYWTGNGSHSGVPPPRRAT